MLETAEEWGMEEVLLNETWVPWVFEGGTENFIHIL